MGGKIINKRIMITRRNLFCKNGHEVIEENAYVQPDGHSYCRRCKQENERRYREKNKNKRKDRKINLEYNLEYKRRYYANNPWAKHYKYAKNRCYKKGKYFKRGIKNEITLQEIKTLWFRDRADLMDCPSIDRIDTKGNYMLENCRFIEHNENSRLGNLGRSSTKRQRESSRKNLTDYLDRINRVPLNKGIKYRQKKYLLENKLMEAIK